MTVDECRLILNVHEPSGLRRDPKKLEVLYSDRNVRILRIFDVAASPEKGMYVVRVDIFKEPEA